MSDKKTVSYRVDQSKAKNVYANAFQTHILADELVIDLGVQLPEQVANKEADASVALHVDTRLVLNYQTAARLANNLAQMVQARMNAAQANQAADIEGKQVAAETAQVE